MIYSTHITSGQDLDSPRLQSAGACSQLMSRSTHVAPLTSAVMRTVSGVGAVTPVHRTPPRRPFRPTGPSLRRRAAISCRLLGPFAYANGGRMQSLRLIGQTGITIQRMGVAQEADSMDCREAGRVRTDDTSTCRVAEDF